MATNSDHSSRLGVSLQGYDQVIAISQAAVNMCLEYRFDQDENANIKNINVMNKKAGTSIVGVMNPPTVELSAMVKERYYGATLFLNFKNGFFNYYDFSDGAPKQNKIPVDGWSIPIEVRFDPQQLAGVPEEIRKSVEGLESYSISQLVIDFTSAHLGSAIWDQVKLTGISTAGGNDPELKSMVSALIAAHLDTLRQPGSHNIVGYTLTEGSVPVPGLKATLTPTSTRLQTMYYKPQGQDASQPGKSGLNAFLIKQMTGQPMPGTDISWTGNWFDSSMNGTLVMSHANFWNNYLLQRLAPYNRQMLSAMNSVLAWTLKPNDKTTGDTPWILDRSPMPSDDKLVFTPNNTGGQCKWTGTNNSKTGTAGAMSFFHNIETSSSIVTDVSWSADSSNIILKTATVIDYKRTDSETSTTTTGSGMSFSSSSEKTYRAKVTVDWSTTLELASVTDTGKLEVRLTQGVPTCDIKVDEAKRAGWSLFFSPDFHANDELTKTTTSFVKQKIASIDLVGKIAEDISSQRHGFVFPGGGVYDMKHPVFSRNGDLLIGLTYRLGAPGN